MGRPKVDLNLIIKDFHVMYNTKEFRDLHSFDHYDYSLITKDNYIGSKTKIIVICNIHNRQFHISILHHRMGHGCIKCGTESRNKAVKISKEVWIERFNKIHNTKEYFNKHGHDHYDYSLIKEIKSSVKKIPIRCIKHDYIFEMKPHAHYTLQCGCKYCGKEDFIICDYSISRNLTNEKVDGRIKLQGRDKLLKRISDVNNANDLCSWQCLKTKCKYIWKASPANILYHKTGCPKCNLSKGETAVSIFLEKLNLKYSMEHIFSDLVNPITDNNLRFDFIVYKNTSVLCLIEFQGEYHFKAATWDGRKNVSLEEANLNLERRKYRDQLKRDYCKTNAIPLIEIPYWEFDSGNLENYLLEKLGNLVPTLEIFGKSQGF